MGAFLCAIVDILGNFEVWKRSTVHLPFGLERAEVLVGYAFSIMLIFMGGDIMSHSVQDMAQSVYLGSFSLHLMAMALSLITMIIAMVLNMLIGMLLCSVLF